ncbi:putative RNA methyltransferase, partial [Staphylococcus cohnii]
MFFKCSICDEKLKRGYKTLACENNHTFDIAKEGYSNLILGHKKSKYDKKLFIARRELNDSSNLYSILISKIIEIIKKYEIKTKNNVIDVGTGEGYILNEISKTFLGENEFLGIDIAKEGVKKAAKSYKNINWLVADLADIPVMNGNVDFLINVLSPSNYDEFKRVLDKEGKLIKIIPNSDYLKEIRNIVFSNHKNKDYDNSDVIDLFEANFNKIEMIDISYKVKLNKE